MHKEVHTSPPGTGTAVRGKTLPQLMYEASEKYENLRALNQRHESGWKPFSLEDFRRHSEETALGLLEIGAHRGDRVALYMESDVYFCMLDMGCLIAGMIDVPIYLTHESEQVEYVIRHSESSIVAVSTLKLLEDISDLLADCPSVKTVIVAEAREDVQLPQVPNKIRVLTLATLRDRGRRRMRSNDDEIKQLLDQISHEDLATIIYTSGTTGKPKGVMLSHENISYNAMTSFSGLPDYRPGPDGEISISFLSLAHIFARALQYGFLAHGTSVYFTTPDCLGGDLRRVRPTIFATVPRVLEKVYGTILERTTELRGPRKWIANWALRLGERFDLQETPTGLYRAKLALADRLVFKKWREGLGGRVRYIISGSAALSPRLINLFASAGVTILEGYGLTETSPVITFNRPDQNRAGTVGVPIAGLEVKIGEDGEILTRGPHIMMGYYKNEERTDDVVDEQGWFHTGDIGEFSDGYLRITDRKKNLFKLSTGKYVIPQPLENRLTTHPLIEQAVVVGSGHKYCAALVFPDQEKVRVYARSQGLDPDRPVEELVRTPQLRELFRQLVEEANSGMDHWSRIKRFNLVLAHLTPESGLLTPSLKVRRSRVHEEFADEIEEMYSESAEDRDALVIVEHAVRHEAA